jgi:hypothetical protein
MALRGRDLIDLFGAASMITGMSRHNVLIGGDARFGAHESRSRRVRR